MSIREGTYHSPSPAMTSELNDRCWEACRGSNEHPDAGIAVIEAGDGWSVLWWTDWVANDWHEFVPNDLVAERHQHLIDAIHGDEMMEDLDDWPSSPRSERLMSKRQFGDQRSCVRCGADVEWHGKEVGWMDRGANTDCDESGHHPVDRDGCVGSFLHKPHTVPSDDRLFTTADQERFRVDGFLFGYPLSDVSYADA